MPELFHTDVLRDLHEKQRLINEAIKEFNSFLEHGHRSQGAGRAAWLAEIRTLASSSGLDIAEWAGNPPA